MMHARTNYTGTVRAPNRIVHRQRVFETKTISVSRCVTFFFFLHQNRPHNTLTASIGHGKRSGGMCYASTEKCAKIRKHGCYMDGNQYRTKIKVVSIARRTNH